MRLDEYFEFLGQDAIRVRGHRVNIEHLLAYYAEGYSPEAIAQEFPGLSLEEIYASITYYLHNKSDVDAYLSRLAERSEKEYQAWLANPSPAVRRLKALKSQRI